MAITKEAVVEKIEVVQTWNVQVATDTVIKEDGTEISRSRHRHVLQPCTSSQDGDTWTHTDTDNLIHSIFCAVLFASVAHGHLYVAHSRLGQSSELSSSLSKAAACTWQSYPAG